MLLLWEQSPGLLLFAKHILVAQIHPTAHIHLPHLALYSTRFTFLKYFLLYGIIQNIFQRKKVIYIYSYTKNHSNCISMVISKFALKATNFRCSTFISTAICYKIITHNASVMGKNTVMQINTTVGILGVLYNYHRITGWLGLQEEPLRSCSSNPLL